jgi:outer membrane lipoprotein carrier protein
VVEGRRITVFGRVFTDNGWRWRRVYHFVRYLALIFGLIGLGVTGLAGDPATGRLLKQVENRYNKAATLEVRFVETYSGPGRPARTETGVLYLRKPGRMRWDYTAPAGKLFVSDGKNVFLYLPSSNYVQKRKLTDSATEDMRAPLAFLLGKLNFEKEFRNTQARPEGGGTLITTEAKSDNLPYSKVEFTVSPAFEIRKLRVLNLDQSVLEFAFEAEKLNPPLANTLFRFQPPAGAEVIEGGGQ